jgi:hypothetical protein
MQSHAVASAFPVPVRAAYQDKFLHIFRLVSFCLRVYIKEVEKKMALQQVNRDKKIFLIVPVM